MNIQEIQTALQAVAIPHTQRTLGSENAIKSVTHDSDGLHITLQFGYPVLHIGNELANRIQEAIIGFTGDTGIHLTSTPWSAHTKCNRVWPPSRA